jgi:subtilase family serine protease
MWQHGGNGAKSWDRIEIPKSSAHVPADDGQRVHTCVYIRMVGGKGKLNLQEETLTPQQLRSIYNLPSSGGSGTIAIVDAYDFPTALNDFNVFSTQYGLPTETGNDATSSSNKVFQVAYATGKQPKGDSDWNMEEALDIEYAHAMAPGAKILLVEAASSSTADMFSAVKKAGHLIGENNGKGEVSMSWTGGTWPSETANDDTFKKKNVVYFASSGDVGGVANYPSTSPNVVAVGGTTVKITPGNAAIASETGWSGSGGGIDTNEPVPSFQQAMSNTVRGHRGVPDISFDADPGSGVWVYLSTPYNGETGWYDVGGTSLACPCVAGIVNLAGHFEKSSAAELEKIYKGLGSTNFRDIVQGTAGGLTCGPGWDEVTGVGSPLGLGGL